MIERCKKCGNDKLRYERLDCGNTAQPCPICGEQNYSFGPQFMQRSGAAEVYDHKCKRCGDVFFIGYKGTRDYCDYCLSSVRSEQTTRRNLARRAKGELSLSQFYYRKASPAVNMNAELIES